MFRQQHGADTPHLGHPPIDPALGGYPTTKKIQHMFALFFATFLNLYMICSTGLETGCKPALLTCVSCVGEK